MNILVVNQYFFPDRSATSQLLTELCEDLAADHEVTVVAGRPSYDPVERPALRGLIAEETHGRVRVLRSWSTSFARSSMRGRLTNYATYMASCIAGAMKATRPDVVLTMTDPPVVSAAAAAAAAARRVPFVYVTQDLFPDTGVALGQIRNPLLARGLGALNRSLLRRAERVVAIGRDMRQRLLGLGADARRLVVIPNWADGSLIRPLEGPSRLRRSQGWAERFVVMHSGNLGLSQELGTLIEAAELLREDPAFAFAVVGDGVAKAELRAEIARRRLPNVTLLPYRDKAELSDSLGAADLHVIGLRKGLAGAIVPSKLYGILAAGRPYVAAVDPSSEPALVAAEHGCGVRVDPGDARALAGAISDLRRGPLETMGRAARSAFEGRYDRPLATAAYAGLLEAVVAERRGARRVVDLTGLEAALSGARADAAVMDMT